jgi:hypothetical protein
VHASNKRLQPKGNATCMAINTITSAKLLRETFTEDFYYMEMARRSVRRALAQKVLRLLTDKGLAPDPFTALNKELCSRLYPSDRLRGHKYRSLRRAVGASRRSHGTSGELDNSPVYEKTDFGRHRVPRKASR